MDGGGEEDGGDCGISDTDRHIYGCMEDWEALRFACSSGSFTQTKFILDSRRQGLSQTAVEMESYAKGVFLDACRFGEERTIAALLTEEWMPSREVLDAWAMRAAAMACERLDFDRAKFVLRGRFPTSSMEGDLLLHSSSSNWDSTFMDWLLRDFGLEATWSDAIGDDERLVAALEAARLMRSVASSNGVGSQRGGTKI